MHRFAPVALATLLAATAPTLLCAQTPTPFTVPAATGHFTDPANLAGERVRPRNGRELPIDGGLGPDGKPDNALALAQQLRRLNTRASLMLIVAHPDDEDGGMLTYYSRGLGARVGILTLNRGEGGQNQMTGDFEDALGLLRTQELLSADRYMGVDQMFGTEVDFGFTKTKQEAFQKWDHQRVLYDAVRAVRIYRPLIIASTFEGAVTDGHGQHQVSGEIAQEVFKAAGDPNVFPELTKEGILPWQPLKVYARVPFSRVSAQGLFDYATGQTVPAEFTNYVTGERFTTTPTADVTINEGQPDPLLTYNATNLADLRTKPANLNEQLSYVQFARIGLGLQRSQIGGGMRVPSPGRSEVSYHRYGSMLKDQPTQEKSFYDGIDISLEGIAPSSPFQHMVRETVSAKIQQAISSFNPKRPGDIGPQLAQALLGVNDAINEIRTFKPFTSTVNENVLHELLIKRAELNDALALAHGVTLDAKSEAQDSVYAHHAVHVKVDLTASADSRCTVEKTWLENAKGVSSEGNYGETSGPHALGDEPFSETLAIVNERAPFDVAFTDTVTRPYFERTSIEQPVYQLRDPSLRNAPQSPPAFRAWASIRCGSSEFQMARVVHGPLDLQPVTIEPSLNISLSEHARVLPLGTHNFTVTTTDHSFGSRAYLLHVCLPTGCDFQHSNLDASRRVYTLNVPNAILGHTFKVTTQGFNADQNPSLVKDPEGFRAIGYDGLPRTNFYTPATLRVVPVDLKLPPENKRRIGYLPGTGDDVPAALASIGLTPTMLKVSDLTADKLKAFDTVILGVRTYNAHPDLHGAPTQALLDFARNGGNVVVQTQTPEFGAADAPYPLSDRNERVIDETAPVKLLDPSSPLLTTPNKITEADFNNWIEERGHGFLDTWDSHYTALTETGDPGAPAEHIQPQAPQRGGLITVQLGKGRWTYVAFALYRQLPEAVPGAFRLFVNLLNP